MALTGSVYSYPTAQCAKVHPVDVSLRSLAVHMAEAGGVAVVVRDDDGGIEGLEVQYNNRVTVEAGLRLHHQRKALWRPLLGPLLDAGRHRDVIQWLGHT